MVDKFAKWFVKDLARCNNYNEVQQEQILYILRILMYELITLIIILSKTTSLNVINSIILNFISIFCIYNQAPFINEKMPLTKEELIRKNKIIGVINSSIFLILSIILFNLRWFSQIIVWTSIVQTMLLFNKYKKVHGGR